MLDDIKFVIPFEKEINFSTIESGKSIILNNIEYFPFYNAKYGFVSYYQSKVENLIIKLTSDKITVTNSWHKFYKGNNYSDYSLKEIYKTYCRLSDLIGFNILDADVKKVSYGLVIETEPKKNYSSWFYYKNSKPAPMMKGAREYGKKFLKTDFNIKGYDKSYEVKSHYGIKLESELFRVEIEVINMKHLNKRKSPLHIYKVKDLLDYEKLQHLMNDLISKYEAIEKDFIYDIENMKKKDIEVLSMLRFEPVRDFLKKNKNKTYKRYKKRITDLQSKIINSVHSLTNKLLIKKATNLLNS
ncbi:MAG: hypothetical protein HN427_07425 [Flavobacteriales bacterium]|jgi:hypothetical protein|nr:hypothetical protein [Flavobacteriales bacterium]